MFFFITLINIFGYYIFILGQKRSQLKTALLHHNPYTIDDVKDLKNKKTMVGSQKRKARKESITRRDIVALNMNSINNNNNNNNNNDNNYNDNNNKIDFNHTKNTSATTITNKTVTPTDQQTTASDLFILATLATLADEKIKI